MKKIFAFLTALILTLVLISCAADDTTPEGMQLVAGGASEGYYFYAPEEWLVSNVGDIKSAYISRVNTTSVSFAEVKLPEEKRSSDYFFKDYFNEHASDFEIMEGYTLKESGKNASFGMNEYAADKAVQYIYSYKYLGYEFSFMQILIQEGEKFYIFTYSAQSTAEEGVKPNYEKYLEKAQSVIENFRFTVPQGEGDEKEPERSDEDGFKLVSNKSHSGFELYVPEDFSTDFTSAIVSASHSDGSSVNLTEATATGISASTYWETRKADLSKIFSDVTEIQKDVKTRLGNNSSALYGDWAYAYEYTYSHAGKTYHVYQILAIDGTKGYVFTYTALEENYLTHLDDIMTVIEKVRF